MYSFKVEQAIRAASVLHHDQVRKGSAPYPYITHLTAVALIVGDYTDEEDTIVAAFLHDSVEDTDYTPDELETDFGPAVKEIVLALSEPLQKDGTAFPWKERKQAYIAQLKKAPEASLMISAADKIHNMRSIVEDYHDEPHRFIADFEGKLEDRIMMYQELSNLLNRRLENDIMSEFNHVFTEYKNFIEHAQKSSQPKLEN